MSLNEEKIQSGLTNEELINKAITFHQAGNFDKAELYYQQILKNFPNHTMVLTNLATLALQVGNLEYGLELIEKSLDLDSSQPGALNSRGVMLQNLNLNEEAVVSFNNAIDQKPDYAEAYANKANSLSVLKKFEEAQLSYDLAIYHRPNYAKAHFNKGKSLKECGELKRAILSFDLAIEFNPNIEYISGEIFHIKMLLCLWNNFSKSQKELKNKIIKNHKVISPFPLLALIDDPKLQKKASEIYANDNFPESHVLPKLKRYQKHSKIRLGYFSADFKMHPVATLTAELYETHDRSKFEIHAFSFGPNTNDEMNLRIRAGVNHFHEIRTMSDKEIALLARSLEIDIAVDLGGYTADSRTGIFAMRAAPIQVNYLGYPGTMGAKYMDYIIADQTLIPKDQRKYYTEKVVYLPDSYQANMNKLNVSKNLFSRKDLGLPTAGFVYCCFNNEFKITPDIFNIWMKILKSVESSVLWLFEKNEDSTKNLKREAMKNGISKNRLIFAKKMPLELHLRRIQQADLFLDTLPYNAHTTSSDALRMGLPVITCIGSSFASRVAASLLDAVKLPELITTNLNEYQSLSIELAKNPIKLKAIKDKLAINVHKSTLFDAQLFTKNLEYAYEKMCDS
jgi:protein O-GlcNAc transferase